MQLRMSWLGSILSSPVRLFISVSFLGWDLSTLIALWCAVDVKLLLPDDFTHCVYFQATLSGNLVIPNVQFSLHMDLYTCTVARWKHNQPLSIHFHFQDWAASDHFPLPIQAWAAFPLALEWAKIQMTKTCVHSSFSNICPFNIVNNMTKVLQTVNHNRQCHSQNSICFNLSVWQWRPQRCRDRRLPWPP